MGKLNRDRHLANKMPKNAGFEQRVDWHREHLMHCSCRTDLPPDIKKAIEAGRSNIGA